MRVPVAFHGYLNADFRLLTPFILKQLWFFWHNNCFSSNGLLKYVFILKYYKLLDKITIL